MPGLSATTSGPRPRAASPTRKINSRTSDLCSPALFAGTTRQRRRVSIFHCPLPAARRPIASSRTSAAPRLPPPPGPPRRPSRPRPCAPAPAAWRRRRARRRVPPPAQRLDLSDQRVRIVSPSRSGHGRRVDAQRSRSVRWRSAIPFRGVGGTLGASWAKAAESAGPDGPPSAIGFSGASFAELTPRLARAASSPGKGVPATSLS